MRPNYFGLQFDMKKNEDIPCISRKISLKHRPINKLATDKLDMFQCPSLKYVNLFTDEPVFLLVKFFITSSHKPQSFLLYIQEDSILPIYPHKFFTGVHFSKLHRIRDSIIYDEMQDERDAGKMGLLRTEKMASKMISEIVEIKTFSNGKKDEFLAILLIQLLHTLIF